MLLKQDFAYTPKGKNRPLHIFLPDGIEAGEQLPVMYFFDGHNLFRDEDATYGKCWGLADFLSGWHRKMIIVGMECGHEGDERLSEYLPYPVRRGMLARFAPMGEETMQWILEEVKPWADRNLPTQPLRECTGIGGSSMGGLMALYGVLRHNRFFSKAACLSSAVGFCMSGVRREIKTCEMDADTRVFLSWGTREARGDRDDKSPDRESWMARANTEIAYALSDRGCRVRLHCERGGGHSEADWEKQVPEVMRFLWDGN